MSITILGTTKDIRTGANVIYAQMPVNKYLEMIGNDFADYFIQRRKEKHKAYQRMKADIKEGALLPSITLAVKPNKVLGINDKIGDKKSLETLLLEPGVADILDGLQRTYILHDLKSEGHLFFEEQNILVEYWLEGDLKRLIYRMIVLNAGQKPMSMRHQIELLFMSLNDIITENLEDVEIMFERDSTRRTSAKKYSLKAIAMAYQVFLTGTTEVKNDVIINELLSDDELDSNEEELVSKFSEFLKYFNYYTQIDKLVEDNYQTKFNSLNWFGTDNTLSGFFAAISVFIKSGKSERIEQSMKKLIVKLKAKENLEYTPLRFDAYEKNKNLYINPKKQNVGSATRRFICNGFKEFFREEGDLSFESCWEQAGDYETN